MLPFWPEEASANERTDLRGGGLQASTELGTADEQREPHVDPLAHLPDVQPRGYFGPSHSAPPRTSGANRSRMTSCTRLGGMITTTSISQNVGQEFRGGRVKAFPSFDTHKDIAVGQFVAMLSPVEERRLGAIFYVDKVRALERAATVDGVMTVTWYWPKCGADQSMQWENGTNGTRIGSRDVGSQAKKTMTTLW